MAINFGMNPQGLEQAYTLDALLPQIAAPPDQPVVDDVPDVPLPAEEPEAAVDPRKDFTEKIAQLMKRMEEDPATYRNEQFKKSWVGKHPILGGIAEFMAGLAKMEGPTAKTTRMIDDDFATRKALNSQLLQTVLGEQRANQASQNAELAQKKAEFQKALGERGMDIREFQVQNQVKMQQLQQDIQMKRLQGQETAREEAMLMQLKKLEMLAGQNSERNMLDWFNAVTRRQAVGSGKSVSPKTTTYVGPDGVPAGSVVVTPGAQGLQGPVKPREVNVNGVVTPVVPPVNAPNIRDFQNR